MVLYRYADQRLEGIHQKSYTGYLWVVELKEDTKLFLQYVPEYVI